MCMLNYKMCMLYTIQYVNLTIDEGREIDQTLNLRNFYSWEYIEWYKLKPVIFYLFV